jgi:hypothetical protein
VAPRERKGGALRLQRELVLARVRDVLADALVPAALEVDHGRLACELGGRLHLEAFEPVRLDLEREVADAVVGRHRARTVRNRSK